MLVVGCGLRGDLQHLAVAEAGAAAVQPPTLLEAGEAAGQRGEVELDALRGHVDRAVPPVVLVHLPLEHAHLLHGEGVQLRTIHK